MEHKKLSEEEMNSFKSWLKEEGIRYFRHLKGLKGSVVPVLKVNPNKNFGISSYPVHFRDGVSIRNWLRENTELGKELDSIELDDCYVKILEEAIK